jgi:carbon monoxide dehydrogenase subunit G
VTLAERDRHAWRARMDVEATDRRIRGAVSAKATMRLTPRDDGSTDLDIHADASILGKLGQFGQAVLRKKADQVMAEFASNLASRLSGNHRAAAGSGASR